MNDQLSIPAFHGEPFIPFFQHAKKNKEATAFECPIEANDNQLAFTSLLIELTNKCDCMSTQS